MPFMELCWLCQEGCLDLHDQRWVLKETAGGRRETADLQGVSGLTVLKSSLLYGLSGVDMRPRPSGHVWKLPW